jgi:hypothetical protein
MSPRQMTPRQMTPRQLPWRRRAGAVVLGVLLTLPVAGCASTDGGGTTTAPEPVSPTEDPAAPGAIWPGTGKARLEQLRGLANRGQRPDLLDPVGAARTYITTALPPDAKQATAGVVLARFRATSPDSGEVTVRGRRMAPTVVSLHRYDPVSGGNMAGQRPIWYVRGLGSPDLAVLDVDYDGDRLTGALVPGRSGRVVLRTSALDGKILQHRAVSAVKGRLIDIGAAAHDQPAVVFSAVLTGDDGITSLRIFRIGAPAR